MMMRARVRRFLESPVTLVAPGPRGRSRAPAYKALTRLAAAGAVALPLTLGLTPPARAQNDGGVTVTVAVVASEYDTPQTPMPRMPKEVKGSPQELSYLAAQCMTYADKRSQEVAPARAEGQRRFSFAACVQQNTDASWQQYIMSGFLGLTIGTLGTVVLMTRNAAGRRTRPGQRRPPAPRHS